MRITSANPKPIDRVGAMLCIMRRDFQVIRDNLPLKIGIHGDLVERYPDQSKTLIRLTIKRHTHGVRYLKSLSAPGALRHDLEGRPLETVTAEHRERAASKFKQRGGQKSHSETRKGEGKGKAGRRPKERQKSQKIAIGYATVTTRSDPPPSDLVRKGYQGGRGTLSLKGKKAAAVSEKPLA